MTLTKHKEKSLEVGPDGRVRTVKIPAYRFPECYLTEKNANGRLFTFPSPHTPLNWATAEALDAFMVMRKNL